MRLATALAAVASVGLAASAFAAPARLSDVQFIAANRCLGLMSSKSLGAPDAAALKRMIDGQVGGRDPYIADKADEARQDALREANRAGETEHARLVAE